MGWRLGVILLDTLEGKLWYRCIHGRRLSHGAWGYSGSVLSMISLMGAVFFTRLFPALEVSFIHPCFDIGRYNIWSDLVLGFCNEECLALLNNYIHLDQTSNCRSGGEQSANDIHEFLASKDAHHL
jgi:hypothetical protein